MDDVQKSGLLYFLLLILFCGSANARNNLAQHIPEGMKERAEQSANVIIPDHIKDRITDLQKTLNSDEWKNNQTKMKQRIMASIGTDSQNAENDQDQLPQMDRPILFVSSSMPIRTLRAYAKALAKTNGVMVLRGGIHGLKKIAPTLRFTAEILKIDKTCVGARCPMLPTPVLIDPVLFERYSVSVVPALVFQENMNLASYCERPDELEVKQGNIVYGDAALSGMFEELFRVTKNRKIKPYLAKLGVK